VPSAQSIQVEIAQRMQLDDVLWRFVAAPAQPTPPPAAAPRPAVAAAVPRPRASTPAAPPSPTPFAVAPPPQPPPAPAASPASEFWVGVRPEPADQMVRIEALAGLIDAHSDRVIPLLREIALDRNSPDEARRAVFVLAQSQSPEAHNTVLEVAHAGAEPVQLAAIREVGRFQDASVSTELMRVYEATGIPRVKRQVVTSLGERADDASLFHIVKTETDSGVRNNAIMTLGRIPTAHPQLRQLYGQAPADSREAVLTALLAARDDDELIRIASTERNPFLRQRARQLLRLLATPKAIKFLTENP
jgi:HEAT repeat protein